MQDARLEISVDPAPRRLRWLRRRLPPTIGFSLGVAGLTAIVIAAGTPPVRVAVPVTVQTPVDVPVVVPVPEPIVVTTAPAPPVHDPLECSVTSGDGVALPEPEVAIGRAIDRADLVPIEDPDAAGTLRVVASELEPVLAVRHDDGSVWVSDDDGRHWTAPFGDAVAQAIAVDADGVVYVATADELAVRGPDGEVDWRHAPAAHCELSGCEDQLAVLGDRVVWFHASTISVSANAGRSWRVVEVDGLWQEHGPTTDVITWHDAVYAVRHYWDQCGVSDSPINRFDGRHAQWDIFHDYFVGGAAVLVPSSDVATAWTWNVRCWPDEATDGHDKPGRCKHVDAARREMLTVATLRPQSGGGRDLATFDGSLVELCPGGTRVIYRDFPYARIAAVDWRGRPLVVVGDTVVRWSAAFGWRELFDRGTHPDLTPDRGSD